MDAGRTILLVLAVLMGQPALAQWEGPSVSDGVHEEPPNDSAHSGPGILGRFPVSGTVNALVIFVQHLDESYEHCGRLTGYDARGIPTFVPADYAGDCAGRAGDSWEIGGYQSWTDDPETEWPLNLPPGPDPDRTRQLPAWAEGLIDPPGTERFTPGSLSDFYDRMSNGAFTLTGEVWDYTYVPQYAPGCYDFNSTCPGMSNYPFTNGAVKLSHEIISYVDRNPYDIDFSSPIWDQYTNGDGADHTPDGVFDMIILVYRFSRLTTMASNHFAPPASGATSLGSPYSTPDAFFRDPLTLGGFDVIDSTIRGSGVLISAQTKKAALRIIGHEIGHRQFGFYNINPGSAHRNADYMSIMTGSPHMSFSAGDRIKVGWANVDFVDVSTIGGVQRYTLRDAAVVDPSEADVLWLRDGTESGCGDVVVEARLQSTFWDRAPGPGNDDGDGGDFYLPNEGLYLSKAPGLPGSCGSFQALYSSLPNGGLEERRTFFGSDRHNPDGMYEPGFGPGHQYTPFTTAPFGFHPSRLDARLAITDISISGNQISFKVWSDYLAEADRGDKVLTQNYTLEGSGMVARRKELRLGGTFEFQGAPTPLRVEPGTVFRLARGSKLLFRRPVDMIGTAESPVRFERQDDAQAWGRIQLDAGADGSRLSYVVADGAADGLYVHAPNVTVRASVFTNNGVGVLGAGQPGLTLSGNTIEHNTGSGVALLFGASAALEDNLIQGNRHGVYVFSSKISQGGFTHNHIVGNTHQGLYVADMSTVWMQDAFNEIANNGQNEIYLAGEVQVHLNAGDADRDGNNDIYDTSHRYGPHYLIYCLGKGQQVLPITWKISARGNYWGEFPPRAYMFYPIDGEAIDFTGYHTHPHVGLKSRDSGALNGMVWQRLGRGEAVRWLPAWSGEGAAPAGAPIHLPGIREGLLLKGQAVRVPWPESGQAPYASFRQARMHRALNGGGTGQPEDLMHELAMLFEVQDALEVEDYERALSLATSYEPYVVNKDLRTGFLIDQMIAHVHLGSYGKGLKALDAAAAIEPDGAAGGHYTAPDYGPVRAYLLEAGTTSTGVVPAPEAGPEPRRFVVEGVYPNPFSARVTIEYVLREATPVSLKVYDVLGREVRTLVEGNQRAGRHTVAFDARSLACGLYLYRLETPGQAATGTMLFMK